MPVDNRLRPAQPVISAMPPPGGAAWVEPWMNTMRGCMQRFKTTNRNPRASRIVLGALSVGAAVMLAACSSSTSAASGGGAPASGSAAASGGSGGNDTSALGDAVTKAEAVPNFADYAAGYGGKLPSLANLKGKKLMIIPGSSAIAACTEIAQADAALAKAVGMVPTIFANQGTTAEHNTAIENAIHQGYAAVNAGCAYDPTTNAPAITQAQKAGIVFSLYVVTQQQPDQVKVPYVNVDPYVLDATLAVDQAVAQHNGQPFDAIGI